jgi:hypothetical protein
MGGMMASSLLAAPHPPFGHLLPLKGTGEGDVLAFTRLFWREKVAEGRMRDRNGEQNHD